MMNDSRPHPRVRNSEAGFSLMELLVSVTVTTVIMGTTLTALNHAMRANDTAVLVTGMNNNLRVAMDLIVRDLLQAGQGLPAGRVIQLPSGANSAQIRMPGPPGTSFLSPLGSTELPAVVTGPGMGPVVNGVASDMITFLAADGSFDQVRLTALAANGSSMTVEPGVDISNGGPDDIEAGQLIMLTKGSSSCLMQVTSVDGNQTVYFANNDSLLLNQRTASEGSIGAMLAEAPPDVPSPTYLPTTATRIRMISYYLDVTTTPGRVRLVRRMNNGHATTFNNNLGTVVGFDLENMSITYDLVDGVTNPSNVRMTAADIDDAGTGACAPNPCTNNQIRKVNIVLAGRSRQPLLRTRQFFRNTLQSQVSLRSLAFVDRYR
jgi:Tfp pilus assembly protein PilW